ncbi:hypothetical protein SAY87_028248 [Trapa incisa]|uniref:Auxin-responsive protein n=2 Tax=Trapa TaxID=22665 RepID=A0AAN7MAE6_TRANT|nr:hypothetical protein SAY87_028248 [Trapa incisa]KAK4801207.1 hypothetical protein SAY86_021694 [Trapa natans]
MGSFENDLNLEATELRLGLPGTEESEKGNGFRSSNKRPLSDSEAKQDGVEEKGPKAAPSPKAQIVGWPPVRSYRKNSLQQKKADPEAASGIYVKVSMDGAPYLRKIDIKAYKGYPELLRALENMFKFTAGEYSEREGYKGSDYAPAYEDKEGDLMLVGDVPWEMFIASCKKLRIMKGSEAIGLGCGL